VQVFKSALAFYRGFAGKITPCGGQHIARCPRATGWVGLLCQYMSI